jgi:hypothetical protein
MSGGENLPSVAVRVCVVADAAVAVEGVFGRDAWSFTAEEKSGAGEESAVEEVAAGDAVVHIGTDIRLRARRALRAPHTSARHVDGEPNSGAEIERCINPVANRKAL